MTPAERAYASAVAQGLPAHVGDPSTLRRLARMFRPPVVACQADGPVGPVLPVRDDTADRPTGTTDSP